MNRLEHTEHLDRKLIDELAQVARETVRDELREQTRKQRRTATLYAASGATALYAGAALALAVGLALAIGLPGWAAALITAALLAAVAYLLRGAARPSGSRPTPTSEAAPTGHDHVVGGSAPGAPPSGLGMPYPPVPPVAPTAGVPATDGPHAAQPGAPRQDDVNPEAPRR
ncbi:phage holin family protein [Streptomyces sp. NPDC008313]|uniref:phage holin family protein n=1 Tax=Streptomyces sp. NPDC008313 TaxID=3364826 RepID=UPI0036ED0F94